MKRRLLAFLLIFMPTVVTLATSHDNILVRHYSEADGLPNNIVNSVIKTRDGFLWFGTMYGICRFDGRQFQSFHGRLMPHSDLPPRKVETLVEDGNGNLWVKTLDWRLSVYFKQEGRFRNIYEEIKRYSRNLQIIKIQADWHGHVFLLTKDKNLLLGCTNAQGGLRITPIRARTGSSPSDYVKNYKLAKAVDLLQHTNMSVNDVAFASGFSDSSYFGKCFRKKYGMSPKEYRHTRNTAAG